MLKEIVKAVLEKTPYRIVRDRGANRFQAIDAALNNMRDRGYQPRVVIDGGAHLGLFSFETKKIFPAAAFHLVEPQPSCIEPLRALCAKEGFVLHECALSDRVGQLGMSLADGPNTGVHVEISRNDAVTLVRATTLDALFGNIVGIEDRALLKLDLQGYELHALRGGAMLLSSIEIILTEVSFFSQAYEPSILELLAFLDEKGFLLYDVAALAGRTRDNRLRQGDLIFARKGTRLLEDGNWA